MKTLRTLQGLLIFAIAVGWSLSARAAVLKANGVQTGVVTMPVSGATPVVLDIAITSVVAGNTFVLCQNDAAIRLPTTRPLCELTSPTNLRITTYDGSGKEVVQWYVVEFLSGVTVQRSPTGGTVLAAGGPPVIVTLAPAVNLAQTFVLISENMNNSTSEYIDEQWTVQAQLTSPTNLQLTRNANATAINVAWQVIQIASAAVQSGTASIAINALTATAVLNPPVDLTRTFLVFTRSGGSQSFGVESFYQTTGQITNATTLTFTRAFQFNNPNEQVDIAWFAVRMTDGTTVQRGLQGPSGTGAPSATMNVALPSAVVTNRSVPFISVMGDPAPANPFSNLDDTSWRAALTTTTNLRLTRSSVLPATNNTSNATVAWQVVQFNNQPNLVDGDGREIFP
jgi:hypothetical protein